MKISIIGSGNMGGAIARALAAFPAIGAGSLTCTARTGRSLAGLSAELKGITTSTDNRSAAKGSDIVILAVKPWIVGSVMKEIGDILAAERPVIISVAAKITLKELAAMLPADAEAAPVIFRAIPNTAIAVGKGVTFITSINATAEQEKLVSGLFGAMGFAMNVNESQLEAGTVLASCGIAYALRYIRAATEGGVQLGFRAADAQKIVCHTIEGAAALLEANGTNPEEEIDKVTTPGGLTIKGLNEMERKGFSTAVIDGLLACK